MHNNLHQKLSPLLQDLARLAPLIGAFAHLTRFTFA